MHVCIQKCNCPGGHVEGLAISADTIIDQLTLKEIIDCLQRIARDTGSELHIEEVTGREFMAGSGLKAESATDEFPSEIEITN